MTKRLIIVLFLFGCEKELPMEPLESNYDDRVIRPVPCCVYPIQQEEE